MDALKEAVNKNEQEYANHLILTGERRFNMRQDDTAHLSNIVLAEF